MADWRVPTIGSIQRTNAALVFPAAATLWYFSSAQGALACVVGAGIVMANLYILGILGRFALAAAGGGRSTAAKLGAAAIPLKLLLVAGLVYLLFSKVRLDGAGFGVGVLTQLLAIIIETGRVSVVRAP